jgi:thiamine-monophosphate kinase
MTPDSAKYNDLRPMMAKMFDVYAMNGTPTQVTVSIGVSNRMSVEALEAFYEGVYAACTKYEVDLIGGDTSSSQKGFIVSVTAIGEVASDKVVMRGTARSGDLVCCSGDLGGAYLGLLFMEREKRIFLESPGVQPELEGESYVIGRLLKPEARRDIIAFFEDAGLQPTAMMDISDGLSSEMLHICERSGLGCVLYEDKLPISEDTRMAAFKFQIDPTACALSGGEDYELVFTVRQEDHEKVAGNDAISIIGYMTEASKGATFITKGGNTHPITAQGWNAFKKHP